MNFIPRVAISVPPGRDYGITLSQTKMVYDQLLADKHCKLMQALLRKKDMLDKECTNIEASKGVDSAMEYAVRAQSELTSMQQEVEKDVIDLQQDYQSKLNKLHAQLETMWHEKQVAQ